MKRAGVGKEKTKRKNLHEKLYEKKMHTAGTVRKKNKHAHIASQKNFHAEAGLPTPTRPPPLTFLMVLP